MLSPTRNRELVTHRAHMGKVVEYQSWTHQRKPLRAPMRQHIYGELQPMDEPAEFPTWLKLLVSAFGLLAIFVTFGGGQ